MWIYIVQNNVNERHLVLNRLISVSYHFCEKEKRAVTFWKNKTISCVGQ